MCVMPDPIFNELSDSMSDPVHLVYDDIVSTTFLLYFVPF